MTYNWDGDVIVQECTVEKKWSVTGSQKPITTDIREFVSPADDVIIKGILNDLKIKKNLPVTKNPGDFDRRAMIIWDHVARAVKYRVDAKQRHGDFWFFPSEVHDLAYGDSEDGSFLLASLLIGSGISPFNVRVTLGELFDRQGNSLGRHCWPMYKNEAGRWCIMESTFNRTPWGLQRADRFTGAEEIRYVPHFCFNNVHLWAIRHEEHFKGGIQNYLKKRHKLANLANPRFPAGGWLSAITGDNSPGHLEMTSEALNKMDFSEDAVSVAGDAAQDPDLYEWYNPAAHAQTDCNLHTGATNQTVSNAITTYLSWFDSGKQRFLTANSVEHSLFFLGYLLHGVQDLASHQGVTNAQHAFESFVFHKDGDDCDHLAANRQIALEFTTQILERLAAKNSALFKKMKAYDAGFTLLGAKVDKEMKCTLLGKVGWDFSIEAYREYKELAKKYERVKDANPLQLWNRDAVFGQLQASV